MAWAETAERLKDELTDKYVVVMDGVPELKRFAGRTGTVKTVNMSGRALVQFEAPADISWYDIDPSYLTVIDAPLPKKKAEPAAEKPAAEKSASKPAAKAKGGLSPLEMARQQGAAGAAPAKPAPAGDGGKKLSPLEMARQQGAAGSGASAESKPAAAKPDGGHKLSPLEMARQQGAAKQGAAAPAAEEEPPAAEAAADEAASQVEEAAKESKPAAPPADTSGMSIIELARQQGAFKG